MGIESISIMHTNINMEGIDMVLGNYLYYHMVNNNGKIMEETNLTPIDKIKIHEYEVERQKKIVDSLEEKLATAKKSLADSIKETNSIKKEAVSYLDKLKKDIS